MSFHNFKSGCLICGNEIIVESKEVEHICAICNKNLYLQLFVVMVIMFVINVIVIPRSLLIYY